MHLATEYWPYARTGGLAEAVRGIATHQARAGRRALVFVPLYRRIRERLPEIEPRGEPFTLDLGSRVETARIYGDPTSAGEAEVLFVEHDRYFDRPGIYGEGADYDDNHLRFSFFCRAALRWLPEVVTGPAVIHPHDWHTALAPVYLRRSLGTDPYFDSIASVLTVHNAGYQGHYGRDVLGELDLDDDLFRPDLMEWYDNVNLLKGGLVFSDIVTTVSPTHAHELRTRAGGFGLDDTFKELQDRFVGILNGIDYSVWDPSADPWIDATFELDDLSGKAACKRWLQDALGLEPLPDRPVFGMTARLVEQKGIDLILRAEMIPRLDAQWIFLGEGEKRYRDALKELAARAPDRIACSFDFTEEREHKLLAGADFLLMPSLYEPCGLTQMRAQRYGALPIVRRVGGLADTVDDRITGFLFDEYEPWALEEAIQYAIDLYGNRPAWEEHVRTAMSRDFSWDRSALEYRRVYARAMALRRLARDEGGR